MKAPWTREELDQLLGALEGELRDVEAEEPHARPLPPLYAAECTAALHRLLATAELRPLVPAETFLAGQLMAQLRQAVHAEALGVKERAYVVTESQIRAARQRGAAR